MRYKPTSKHHRRPRSLGGSDHSRNISRVSVTQHQAWHTLFQNYPPEKIAQIITDVWLDPDYEIVVTPKAIKKVA
jgi:hypothetical protein